MLSNIGKHQLLYDHSYMDACNTQIDFLGFRNLWLKREMKNVTNINVTVQTFILSIKCETLLRLSSTLEGSMTNLPPVSSSSAPSDSMISRNR